MHSGWPFSRAFALSTGMARLDISEPLNFTVDFYVHVVKNDVVFSALCACATVMYVYFDFSKVFLQNGIVLLM